MSGEVENQELIRTVAGLEVEVKHVKEALSLLGERFEERFERLEMLMRQTYIPRAEVSQIVETIRAEIRTVDNRVDGVARDVGEVSKAAQEAARAAKGKAPEWVSVVIGVLTLAVGTLLGMVVKR